jgi:hypothetical protein
MNTQRNSATRISRRGLLPAITHAADMEVEPARVEALLSAARRFGVPVNLSSRTTHLLGSTALEVYIGLKAEAV